VKEQIIIIKKIGEELICSEDDFKIILPNYPKLGGDEIIFSRALENEIKYLESEIEYFIKGLHVIELTYRNKMQSEFGFGSPSRTYKFIQRLAKSNTVQAENLEKWIADNGGNYYIKKSN
jgi:hypothetical protein